jgi:erythromycin esterase-like protein
MAERELLNAIRSSLVRIDGSSGDYDSLIERAGEATVVLIGESSHGTHEFYSERAKITKRLIKEKGFNAVAVEADWPDALRINRFVRGTGQDQLATDALAEFRRFPMWMWRNTVVLDFIGWLRSYNETNGPKKVGFYGLDLYSLHSSIEAVLEYLDKVDPQAAHKAREYYSCFDNFGEDSQYYGYATGLGLSEPCMNEASLQLVEMRNRACEYAEMDPNAGPEEFFYAEQNARLVKNAEEYYRSMFQQRVSSWNLRDTHMADTLSALTAHIETRESPKVVVWAHNSHIGDARATQMADEGEINLGQLVRERFKSCVIVGFSTFSGTVTAATNWDGPAERKRVRPALAGSIEDIMHRAGIQGFYLDLSRPELDGLGGRRLERAIGVIYRPQTERQSHYFYTSLPAQFDYLIHIDETRAVEPLEQTTKWTEGDAPQTFPAGV